MDELLQRALDRRDALRRELATVERFIMEYSAQTSPAPRAPAGFQQELFRAERPAGRADRAARVAAMMDEAERLILEEGQPLTRGQLLARLQAAGHQIEGTDKSKVLGTNLWRSRRFDNIIGAGYWPRSTPVPPRLRGFALRDTGLS